MGLISLEEAARLGLLPDEMMGLFPAVGRSQLFGSPLAIRFGRQSRAGAGPLERAVGGYGFQHAAPGITPLRFGLGPLMAGLGLSPSPSAVSAPGAVPTGRAAKAKGGPVSVETLMGRQEPQDIALLIRLVQAGLLSPSVLEALSRPTGRAPATIPTTARAAAPSGIAEPLAQTGQVLRTASAAEQLVRAIQGVPPPFTIPPETRLPLEVQRAGERAPFGPGIVPPGLSVEATRTLEGMLGSLSPEEAALLTPEDIAQLEALAREVGGGVLPGSVPPSDVGEAGEVGVPLAGSGAGGIPPTQGGGLSLPSAGQTIGGLLAALQLAQGGQALAEGRIGPGALQVGSGGLQAAKLLFPEAFKTAVPSLGQVLGQSATNIATGTLQGSAAASEAARSAIMSGTTGAAGSLAGALPLVNIAALGLGLGMGSKGELAPRAGESFGSAFPRAMGSPEAQVAGYVGGPILSGLVSAAKAGGLFGEHRSLRAKQTAELNEAGRLGDTLRGPITGLEGAGDFEAFFNAGGAVGYMSQPAEFVRRALSDPGSIMAASAPGGRWDEPSAMGVRTSLLVPSVQATVTSAIQNARRLAEQPGALDSLARAEYQAQRRAIERQSQAEMDAIRGEYFRPETTTYLGGEGGTMTSPSIQDVAGFDQAAAPIRARMQGQLSALDQQMAADPYSVLPPNFQALLPPSPPDTGPPPSAATPPPPVAAGEEEAPLTPTEPLASLRAGGPVTRTGLYQLHAGETVVPAESRGEDPNAPLIQGDTLLAHHEQSETVQLPNGNWVNVYGRNIPRKAGQRLPGTPEYGSVEEAVDAARKRSEEEGRKPEQQNWYLPLTPGEPVQAKANPDPATYWRLAMTSEEAQAAIRSGDPAETPILAPQMILTLPPRKRAAAAEFLRRRQYEDPSGTLMDVVQAQTPRTAMAPPTTGRGLAPMRVPGSEPGGPGLPSVEESTEEGIADYYRKQEGEKFPWGPHIPFGTRRLAPVAA